MKRAGIIYPSPEKRQQLIELAKAAGQVLESVRGGKVSFESGVKQLMDTPFNMGRVTAQTWLHPKVP